MVFNRRKHFYYKDTIPAFPCADSDVVDYFNLSQLSSGNLATTLADLGLTYNELVIAVCNYITGLKTNSLYNRFIALYFYLGNTYDAQKINFISRGNTNADYRLSASGGITYDSFGAIPNGINGYFNSWIQPSSVAAAPTQFNFGWYSRTNDFTTAALYGAYSGGGGNRFARHRTDAARYDLGANLSPTFTPNPSTKLHGIFNTASGARFYRDKTFINSFLITGNLPTTWFFIGAASNAANAAGFFMPHQRALDFVSVGQWTTGEIDIFNTLTDDYINAINRNV